MAKSKRPDIDDHDEAAVAPMHSKRERDQMMKRKKKMNPEMMDQKPVKKPGKKKGKK